MPILVICPGCKARFNVSDKFAGKEGPCPKCKTLLRVPSPDDVKIAEPEEYAAGGKDSKGRPAVKPIARQDAKISPLGLGVVVGVSAGLLIGGWLAGEWMRTAYWPLGLGAIVVGFFCALGGYWVLRDPELEPHRGQTLYLRAAICAVGYAALWGAFALLPADWISANAWNWMLLAPPFLAAGGFIALASFDLDYTTGVLHYCFYLAATIVLRWVVGMHALWAIAEPAIATL